MSAAAENTKIPLAIHACEDGENLSEISTIYYGLDACIQSFYQAFNEDTKAGKDRAYHLVMAAEQLIRDIGKQAGCI